MCICLHLDKRLCAKYVQPHSLQGPDKAEKICGHVKQPKITTVTEIRQSAALHDNE